MSEGIEALPRDRDAAIALLFAAHHGRLVGLARLLVDDVPSAEDVVQDAFAGLVRRWPWLRDKDRALGYLQAAVVNGARSNLRRRRTETLNRVKAASAAPSAETDAVNSDERKRVFAALSLLPTRQRQVLVLRYYLDQPEAEIAATLSISAGAVKQHASRGLAALARQLEATR